MKCDKCGYSDNGSGDWAHVCGSVKIKESKMNPRLREIEKLSGLEIYGLGAKRDRWEQTLEKFAELIIQDCDRYARGTWEHGHLLGGDLKRLFGFEDKE